MGYAHADKSLRGVDREMKKEDADQLIRCVKECWWRVGVLLFLIFIFVLLVLHGWPQGDWGMGWGALGAVATCVTGCAAVLIAYRQKKSSDAQRFHLGWLARRDANQLIGSVNQELIRVVLTTEKLTSPENFNVPKWIDALEEIVDIRKKLPRDDDGYDTKNLLDEELIHALHELKEKIADLDDDPQTINPYAKKPEDLNMNLVAIWIQNEMVPLREVADAVGQGLEGLGFQGARKAIMERYGNALDGIRSVF